jgi:hypothetical protein
VLVIYLAIINVFDGIATFYGLTNGLIEESNPLMAMVYENHPLLFLAVKIVLSLLLIGILTIVRTSHSFLLNKLILCSAILYTLVCFKHYYWISLAYIL